MRVGWGREAEEGRGGMQGWKVREGRKGRGWIAYIEQGKAGSMGGGICRWIGGRGWRQVGG